MITEDLGRLESIPVTAEMEGMTYEEAFIKGLAGTLTDSRAPALVVGLLSTNRVVEALLGRLRGEVGGLGEDVAGHVGTLGRGPGPGSGASSLALTRGRVLRLGPAGARGLRRGDRLLALRAGGSARDASRCRPRQPRPSSRGSGPRTTSTSASAASPPSSASWTTTSRPDSSPPVSARSWNPPSCPYHQSSSQTKTTINVTTYSK